MSTPRRLSTVDLQTTLSPVAHGVLAALAAREDPAHAALSVVVTRLLREEVERLAPGTWDVLVNVAQLSEGAPRPPREVSGEIAAHLAAVLRARASR